MNKIGSKLSELRTQLGLSQPEVAKILTNRGLDTNGQKISKWETDYSVPNAYQFLALCNIYEVRDVLETFGIEKSPFSQLNAEGRKKANEYIELLVLSKKFENEDCKIIPLKRSIKLFDLPVSAGNGEFLTSDSYELIDVNEFVPEAADFGLRVSGNSMEPEYCNGQIVWVHQQDVLNDGEIGIFGFDSNAYCKKLSFTTAGIKLISLNTDYEPIEIPKGSDLHVFGKVIGGCMKYDI